MVLLRELQQYFIPLPTGALQHVILHYTFTIDNENVLEIVVRSIYSIRKYLKYISKIPIISWGY